MKIKPNFNDDFYCRTIEEFENEIVPGRVKTEQIGWFLRLLPSAVIIGATLAPSSWRIWVAIAAMVWVLATLFTFLDELNENIRFVRHQMRAFRDAVAETHECVVRYNDPYGNFNLFDALDLINRNWEHPRPRPTTTNSVEPVK
jgi:hypothetical protein